MDAALENPCESRVTLRLALLAVPRETVGHIWTLEDRVQDLQDPTGEDGNHRVYLSRNARRSRSHAPELVILCWYDSKGHIGPLLRGREYSGPRAQRTQFTTLTLQTWLRDVNVKGEPAAKPERRRFPKPGKNAD